MTPERYEKLCELFFQAVEMEPDRRKAFLEEKCADDASLRGEVERLLANDRREQEDSIFPEPDKVFWIPESHDPMIGRWIGPYEINRLISIGGMGEVYLAIQREPFTRRVAIKFIKPGLASQAILQRFCNERQILAALQHPIHSPKENRRVQQAIVMDEAR
jgi:serine/threonine protein kinase